MFCISPQFHCKIGVQSCVAQRIDDRFNSREASWILGNHLCKKESMMLEAVVFIKLTLDYRIREIIYYNQDGGLWSQLKRTETRDNFEGKDKALCFYNILVLDATSQHFFLTAQIFSLMTKEWLIKQNLSLNNGGYQFKAHQGPFKC